MIINITKTKLMIIAKDKKTYELSIKTKGDLCRRVKNAYDSLLPDIVITNKDLFTNECLYEII